MDPTTVLRLKKIELSLRAAERSAGLQAQRRIAVLAVCVAFGASAGLGGLAGQVPALAAASGLAVSVALVALQLRALRVLSERLDAATARALDAIDKLIARGGESDVDDEADAPGA